jgi:hypothetical protein
MAVHAGRRPPDPLDIFNIDLFGTSNAIWRTLITDQSPCGPCLSRFHPRTGKVPSRISPAHPSLGTMCEVLCYGLPVPRSFASTYTEPNPGIFEGNLPGGMTPTEFTYTRPFWTRCSKALANRTLFTTRNGFLGVGPLGAKTGDVVVVLFGADVPFVLRPVSAGYKLLGECYVHSIMHGEVLSVLREFGTKMFNIN